MTSGNPSIIRITRRFAASAERVFNVWLDPNKAGQWLFAHPGGEMVRVEINACIGGSFVFVDRRDGEDVEHVGQYLEIDRPRRLAFTFAVPKYSPHFTRVSIDIVRLSTGCELTLTHEEVLRGWVDRTAEGWGKIRESTNGNLEDSVESAKRGVPIESNPLKAPLN